MTVKEAAQLWGISARHIQQLCTSGRIPGAVKFGTTWAIPSDLTNPEQAMNTGEAPKNPAAQPIPPQAMPLLNTPFHPGTCLATVHAMPEGPGKQIALAEYYYFSGQSEKASDAAEPFLTHENLLLRLSACWIYAYSNLALDRIENARIAMAHVQAAKDSITQDTPPEEVAFAVCVNTGARVLLHLPLPEELPSMKPYISRLTPGLRMLALYVQAHAAYLRGEYWSSVGMAETALLLEGDVYPIPSIYLHLVATMNYMSLRQVDEARNHLLAAWELAQPDDLIEPLAEHHGLIGGMLEAALKKDWPEDFRRIIAITYKFSAGWRKIHNPDTGESVADNLTTTEFAAAMLAARNWSNKEIAAHLGVTENTVKTHLAGAMQKLHISQRKELQAFMLR